jgi:hypothetical protein
MVRFTHGISLKQIGLVYLLMSLLLLSISCAGKTPPTIARDTAQRGEMLMNAVHAVQKEVIAAESRKAIPTEAARRSMEVFKKVGDAGQEVANGLDSLVTLTAGSTEAASVVQRVQAALAVVDSGILEALVPIGDEATRNQVVQLAREVNKIATEIQLVLAGFRR